jgi:secreted PhoX family phosphatase
MFVNVQHPGDRSTPTQFTSHWPANDGSSRPRSATVIITKDDGGVIGS